jgi:hypothetical protein
MMMGGAHDSRRRLWPRVAEISKEHRLMTGWLMEQECGKEVWAGLDKGGAKCLIVGFFSSSLEMHYSREYPTELVYVWVRRG